MEGMSDKPAEELLPLAKSWLQPAVGEPLTEGLNVEYDPAQRAYVLTRAGGQVKQLQVKLAASPQSPVVNPAFVVANWGSDKTATILLGGKQPDDSIGHPPRHRPPGKRGQCAGRLDRNVDDQTIAGHHRIGQSPRTPKTGSNADDYQPWKTRAGRVDGRWNIRGPGISTGGSPLSSLRELVDLFPTRCDVSGIEVLSTRTPTTNPGIDNPLPSIERVFSLGRSDSLRAEVRHTCRTNQSDSSSRWTGGPHLTSAVEMTTMPTRAGLRGSACRRTPARFPWRVGRPHRRRKTQLPNPSGQPILEGTHLRQPASRFPARGRGYPEPVLDQLEIPGSGGWECAWRAIPSWLASPPIRPRISDRDAAEIWPVISDGRGRRKRTGQVGRHR